jgi:hypothetical protein
MEKRMRTNLSIVRQLNRSSASGLLALNHQDKRFAENEQLWPLEDAESLGVDAEHQPTKIAEIGDTTP